ncbi:MAG: aminopeptidase P family protein [Mesorhizobium sp.]|uniref:M24 family metallopeptidase n=1 Tax=Mesorhizobium sp. TaxID=1871066 RepID=UPI00122654CA|nr:Xaa-Pro peptidase family protein [Mesorhizobium sp.]TIP69271.1 MAG: aminopeptidase P family protein [Mesorhizobium sp.]TIR47623.1 MAG: aminopeptidase P family protein [Mesorhizobium sp.]TJV92864.1 MAG: aminopeptidase P family protein [Mesorhizobium sp.]
MNDEEYYAKRKSRSVPKELAFTEVEFRQRLDAVRKVMDKKGLDALLITHYPNVGYLSGLQTFGSGWYMCMLVPREGEPVLHIGHLEFANALLTSWVADIRGVRWAAGGEAEGFVEIVKERKLEEKRIGLELGRSGLSLRFFEGLKRGLPNATFIDASDVVVEPRMIKSPAELGYMRQAAAITKKGLDAALSVTRAGVTDNKIAATLSETLIREGSEFFSMQPSVATGHRSGIVHATYKRTALKQGDTVILEFGAAYERYSSAIYHTIAIGQPSPDVVKQAAVLNDALAVLFGAVRPGRTVHDVAREVSVALEELWPEPAVYGYSIGSGAPPTWCEDSCYIREGVELELKPGMTFHSPIGELIPGAPGVGFSETWAVTETGCEVLTKHDTNLTVVDA